MELKEFPGYDLLKPVGLCLLLLVLPGCETVGFLSSGSLLNQSPLARSLDQEDRIQAAGAIDAALASPSNKPLSWRNRSTGNRGQVVPGPVLIAGLSESGLMYPGPVGLFVDSPLETALGQYRLSRNSNIRLGPTTEAKRLITLDKGTRLRALGRDNKSNWYLVARGEKILGYVYGGLVTQSGSGGDILLGGPTVYPVYCRSFTQTIQLRDGREDETTSTVCRKRNGRWARASSMGVGM